MEESTGKERFPLITALLIATNVLAFLYTEWQGSTLDADYMIRAGAMYGPAFLGEHEYYRIFTHFFLHFGFEHLLNNMVSLLVLGYALENGIGRLCFGGIYFFSGVFSGLVSAFSLEFSGEGATVVSCGASGAIYGLMGALLVMLIVNRKNNLKKQIPRFMLYIALSLYSGNQDPGIDNMAHVGGFVGGILICLMMCILKRIFSYRKEQVI